MALVYRRLSGAGSRFVSWYDSCLQSRRLLTTTVSGSLLGFAGDSITQSATRARTGDAYDGRRGLCFGLFGGFLTGPVNVLWLGQLDRAVRWLAPAGGPVAIASKVCAQTFIMQPMIYTPLFFTFNGLVRGWSLDAFRERVRDDYARTVKVIVDPNLHP